MLDNLSDKELVTKFKAGDKAAFEELFHRYKEKAFHLAMRISRNTEDAEEIIQETFMNVYRKIDSFEEKSAFASWLYRITANSAFMKLRTRKKHDAIPMEDSWLSNKELSICVRSDTSDADFISVRHELQERLQMAIATLPADYREIFILRDVDGLSNEEVSEVVKATVAAVKSRLHRAREMLKKQLACYYADYLNKDQIFVGKMAA